MLNMKPLSEVVPLSLSDVSAVGHGLNRPECVLCTKQGDLYVSDKSGGIRHLHPDGSIRQIGDSPELIPNGFALLEDGSFVVANLADNGGVWHIDQQGRSRPLFTEVEGISLPSVNFVWLDHKMRLWVCVSTIRPGEHRFSNDMPDGLIVVKDKKGARVVADGIHWTNECRIDASGGYLYVNETFGRRMLRFRVGADASLQDREVVTEFAAGTFPDGMAIDLEGGIWVASVVSNRIIRVMPDGSQTIVLEDSDDEHVGALETAFQQNQLTRELVYNDHSRKLSNVTSIAFGGHDLRTAYMGNINGRSINAFTSPVAGLPPVHWNW